MAKTKKLLKNVVGECGPSLPAQRIYIDLEGQDTAQIKGLTVGQKVQILVEGTVKGLSQRERQDYDDPKKTVKTGDIQLENYSVEVLEDEKNEFTKMAEED